MNKKIGFIGCGNMGKAMLKGLLSSEEISSKDIIISTRSEESRDKILKEFEVKCTLSNIEVAKESEILFLAVKPNMYKQIIEEIKNFLKDDVIIISIA
ncbi:pyrroline-5-carboxylate reductase, partial [Clostridium perfringens]